MTRLPGADPGNATPPHDPRDTTPPTAADASGVRAARREPSVSRPPAEEFFEVVDAGDRVVGLARRSECHGNPDLVHRTVHVVVYSSAGRILLQKRTADKDVQPGKWDTAVGGHLAVGEDYLTAVRREMVEEIGLPPDQPLEFLFDSRIRNAVESENVRVFRTVSDGPFHRQPEEVDELRFWDRPEILAALGTGVFTPNLEAELHRLGLAGEEKPWSKGDTMEPAPRPTRRNFPGNAAVTGTGLTILPGDVLGGSRHPAANDRINHAVIGCGGMGNGHIGYVLRDPQAKLVAVCDVDSEHLSRTKARGGHDCAAYHDFREMLDNEDIDVVHVATPPHWHALQAVAALDAGCDVWAEKPMTRTVAEGQHMIDAVRRNGRVFRLNTWFRLYGNFYGLGTTVKPIKKLVMNGLLGWPLTVRVSAHTGFAWKTKQWSGRIDVPPEPVPPQLDYDFWLGPAPFKPYFRHRTHATFRGYWDYDGGGLADMGQHYLDPVQYVLDKDDTSPVEVEAYAPWPPHPDAVGLWGRVWMKYADGCTIILESCEWGEEETKDKPFIEGPMGKIYRGFRTDPPDLAEKVKLLPDPEPMISDFNVSIRTRGRFGLNEINGNRSNLLVHLANCAIRTGRKLTFDPQALRFVNDEAANRLAEQPMRAPWRLT